MNREPRITRGALQGLKVLEYSQFVSGPYCAKLLADLGAEVIKIEEPGVGDKARGSGPFMNGIPHQERSGLFAYLNTNKLAVTLNIRTAEGKELFKRLAKDANILVENNSPHEMEKLGFDYTSLSRINPKLVMTSITPFGQTGPYRNYKGCELIIYHMSGAGNSTPRFAEPGQPPLKTGGQQTDFYTGITAAVATMCAVWRAEIAGRGQHVDISAWECFMNNMWPYFNFYIFENDIASRCGRPRTGLLAILPCSDGYVSFQLSQEHEWRNFVQLMGNPDWAESEVFKNQLMRAEYWDGLKVLMVDLLSDQQKQQLFHAAQASRCPIGPVNTIDEVVNCEHLAAREFFVEIQHPEIGKLRYPSAPYKFSQTPVRVVRPAPLLGQHNEEVYGNRLGYSREDLVRMRELGII